MAEGHVQSGKNRLLLTLDSEVCTAIEPHLERVDLPLKHYVYKPDKPIEYAYFPINGVISMLAHMEDELIEVATIGNEGMVGLPLFLGVDLTPGSAFAQVPGTALRIKADAFRDIALEHEPFRYMLHRYTQALMVQISQGNGCNRLHSIEERCARWLLLTHDRVGKDEFSLTQEFLGQMLGVRRAGVNLIASQFQKAGLIEYSRGRIIVLDRQGLESAACLCYGIIRKEYDRLLNGQAPPKKRVR